MEAEKPQLLKGVDFAGVHWNQIVVELHEWGRVIAMMQSLNLNYIKRLQISK
jgi:hypothetical protein